MTVQLDHTIIPTRDKFESATFFAEVFGLAPPVAMGPFAAVDLAHGLSIDFGDADGVIRPLHYAFRVDDDEFEAIFARVTARGLPYWGDPRRTRPGEIAQRGTGRGFYFEEPSGHYLEVLTRPV